jgi:uncharacterized protein YjbI with pentapeptide repeats
MTKSELVARYTAGERNFNNAALERVDLRATRLDGVSLRNADLHNANMDGVSLRNADFEGANLDGVSLRNADLRRANFCNTDLHNADLEGADLRNTNFRNANLARVDLEGANLSNANLDGINLEGANLEGAIGFRFIGALDPLLLREQVAIHIQAQPNLHDQSSWGDGSPNPGCATKCCVAGWICHLGGGSRGESVSSAALRLAWHPDFPMPSFSSMASKADILRDLLAHKG